MDKVKIALSILLALASMGLAQEELMTNVTIKPLVHWAAGARDGSPFFSIDSTSTDTSKPYISFKWSGVVLQVDGDPDSTYLNVIAQCGNNFNLAPIAANCDTLNIVEPGVYVWQINLPISQWFRVIFEGTDSTGYVAIDSSFVNRNW